MGVKMEFIEQIRGEIMLSFREDEAQKLIEFKVSGRFTKENFEEFERKIQPRIDKWSGIRLVEVIENLEGVEMQAFLKDMVFGIKNWKNFNKVEKCAVVADAKWIRNIADGVDPLLKPQIKTFLPTQLEEARDWVLH